MKGMAGDDDTTLRMERLIASPPDVLFALWSEPAHFARWWAPDGCEVIVDLLDVRPGGGWRTTLRKPDGSRAASGGTYRIVEPPRVLSFTWAWEDQHGARGHETEVTVTFDQVPGGTRLVLIQQRFENSDVCDRHTIGWSAAIDRLERTAN